MALLFKSSQRTTLCQKSVWKENLVTPEGQEEDDDGNDESVIIVMESTNMVQSLWCF